MKKTRATVLILVGLGIAAQAAGPVPDYQWDFNMTNSTPATNYILPTRIRGAGPFPATQEGVLYMGTTNLLGLTSSGVGTSPYDRDVSLSGTMGGAGPLIQTPAPANTLSNVGIVTNFTVTFWIKANSEMHLIPRFLLMGQQNVDFGNNVNNMVFVHYENGPFPFRYLQCILNGVGSSGLPHRCIGPNGLLDAATNDWLFVALTYDSTLDPLVTSNVYFYAGNRFNTLPPGSGDAYYGTSVNSVPPSSTNGPGFINWSPSLNGDGITYGISNVWVYIGNRSFMDRGFNGRFDDVRFYPNRVLTREELDQVRQDPGGMPPLPLAQLTMALSETNVVLMWPTNVVGYTLQSATNLNPPVAWSTVSPAPVVVSGVNTVTNNISDEQKFYRLNH